MNKKKTLIFALLATLLSGSALAIDNNDNAESFKSGASWVSVGDGFDCDYYVSSTRLQNAIDAGYEEIRIVEGTHAENILIDDVSVKLYGGYATCADANSNVYDSTSVASEISPAIGSGLPAVRIEGDSQNNQITFRNLSVKFGEGGTSHYGGGISIKNADADVVLKTVTIRQNKGWFGGGLSVTGGSTDVNMEGVNISVNNTTLYGGGIYCEGLGNKIVIDRDDNFGSLIVNNSALAGGGVSAQAQCHFVSYASMYFNTSTSHGGGIRAANGALVELIGNKRCFDAIGPIPAYCIGNDNGPVDIAYNRADSDNNAAGNGGAIYATGSDTVVRATNVRVNSNIAHDGGAVFVTDGALFETMIAQDGPGKVSFSCWDNGRCNQFANNKATEDNGSGGAFYAESGAQLEVVGTHIEGNRADFGAAFTVGGFNTDLKLEGSYVTGNGAADADGYGDISPVYIKEDGDVRIEYTTIADNHAALYNIYNSKGALRLYSNIIHEQNSNPAMTNFEPVYASEDCNIVNALGDITGSSNIVDDPEFVDRANGDYHLNASLSPAVDYCDEAVAQHTAQDTDQEDRGWDDYTASNNLGPFDVGADETYGNDIIFKDGLD